MWPQCVWAMRSLFQEPRFRLGLVPSSRSPIGPLDHWAACNGSLPLKSPPFVLLCPSPLHIEVLRNLSEGIVREGTDSWSVSHASLSRLDSVWALGSHCSSEQGCHCCGIEDALGKGWGPEDQPCRWSRWGSTIKRTPLPQRECLC